MQTLFFNVVQLSVRSYILELLLLESTHEGSYTVICDCWIKSYAGKYRKVQLYTTFCCVKLCLM